MKRHTTSPRKDWQELVTSQGFGHHSYSDGSIYWDESAFYSFTKDESELFFTTAQRLYKNLISVAESVVEEHRYHELGLPLGSLPLIAHSWEADDPTFLARFDFVYSGDSPPRLLDTHMDTPGMLFESAVIQWNWKEEVFPKESQYNSLYETLLDTYREYYLPGRTIHFSTPRRGITPQYVDAEYLRDIARAVGVQPRFLKMSELDWDPLQGRFLDQEKFPVELLMKLYPWEWMLTEKLGEYLLADSMVLIEPAWKMLLANKASLALASELSSMTNEMVQYSVKRSSSTTEAVTNFKPHSTEWFSSSRYGTKSLAFDSIPLVYREPINLPEFDGNFPIVSCWLISGFPAGIAVRENDRYDGRGKWRFIPHILMT
jgi:glutathionylspermidine synthase